jgi:hypothetical protein
VCSTKHHDWRFAVKQSLISALTALALALTAPATLLAQTQPAPSGNTARAKPSESEKVKEKVNALGIGHRVTVVLRNGNEYYGALGESGDDAFELSEVDLNQKITIAYSDVKKVRNGFGNPNKFNGKRWHPGWHIAGLLTVIGLTVALAVAGATARD